MDIFLRELFQRPFVLASWDVLSRWWILIRGREKSGRGKERVERDESEAGRRLVVASCVA